MTWYRLMIWKREVEKTKRDAIEKAEQYHNSPKLSEYYVHIAEVADHQLSLLERLVQEALDEEELKREKENKNAETNN